MTDPKARKANRFKFDSKEMALRGRIGAYRLHSTHDPKETTEAARHAFMSRFEQEVDPDNALPPHERERRSLAARKAYFASLALKSSKSRKARYMKKRNKTDG